MEKAPRNPNAGLWATKKEKLKQRSLRNHVAFMQFVLHFFNQIGHF
jgi:hypothetical protein